LPWSRVVALQQEQEVCNTTIQTYGDKQAATLHWVSPKIYKNIRIENWRTIFDYGNQPNIRTWLIGLFQAENAALAITATELFCPDFDRAKTRTALEKTRFAWRFDARLIQGRTVIFDGAHNPQKMQALVDTLRVLYPAKNIVRYIAFKQGKDRQEMLTIMQTLSSNFVLWSFAGVQDMSFCNVSQKDIVNYLEWANVKYSQDPTEFFLNIQAHIPEDSVVVVTGSLYWLSKVYVIFS
jgi:dihydrofolate synthase/folylpolyglutamate synthase